METILIATDFSPAAHNATVYGFKLARQLAAKVILFTAYQPSLALPDSALYVSPEDLEKNSKKLLREEANAVDPGKTVELEIKSHEGTTTRSIVDAALENNVSYIIVGMKDRGKETRRYFGTTVTHLSKHSAIPVIVVPADAAFAVPEAIALACDLPNDADLTVLHPLKKMVENFNSELFVVRVLEKRLDEAEENEMKSGRLSWFLADVEHHYKFIESSNVVKALNTFVEQKAVNMIAVIPHQHSILEKIFSRSVTKELIFKTSIPLMILPDKSSVTKAQNGAIDYSSEFSIGVD